MKKFVAILSVMAILCGCQSTPVITPELSAINAVYAVDATIPANSKSPAEVLDKMRSINLTGCPKDFVSAYNDYIDAWQSMADLSKKMYALDMPKASSDMANFLSNFRSSPIASAVALKKDWPAFANEIDVATSRIFNAFVALKSIGVRYDAIYPKANNLF